MADTLKPGVGVAIKPKALKDVVTEIEAHKADIRSWSGAHAKRCGNKLATITELKKDAKDAGADTKVLGAVLAYREDKRKTEEHREKLEGEQQELFDQYLHMLGDADESDVRSNAQRERAPAHAN